MEQETIEAGAQDTEEAAKWEALCAAQDAQENDSEYGEGDNGAGWNW